MEKTVPERLTADEGFHEIQLSGKQIVFLFMATAFVSVLVFLLGVFVGRGVQSRRVAEVEHLPADPTVTAVPATAPLPAEPRAETLTYPDRLEGDEPVAENVNPPSTVQPAPTPEPVAPPPVEDGWVVQVAALRNRSTALAIAKQLYDKGYPAFLVDPEPDAPAPVHRVRVGRYRDRAEAERVSRQLEREEQFKPLITR
jgi:cell division septation protein DedD